MYKVVFWGIGDGYNFFTSLHGHDMVEVVALVDSNKGGYYQKIDGISVIKPDNLIADISFDYLIVGVIDDQTNKEIISKALALGINRDVILPLRIFKIPFFDFDEYIKIKNSNISILSDRCFAGLLYHKFGMKFTSPTINMFSDNENYLRFLRNIKSHLAEPMVEVEDYIEKPYRGMYTYPRGRVGDAEWVFSHDETFETGVERWKKGVERFNYDNYIVTMTIYSEEAAYEFDSLPIKNKVGSYWRDIGLNSVVFMPEWNDPHTRARCNYNFGSLVNRVASENCGIRSIDWMRALLHKDGFRRVEA